MSFRLRRAGESIGLFDAEGAPIDRVTFGEQDQDVSEGRLPDGAPDIVIQDQPTPGAPNRDVGARPLITGYAVTNEGFVIEWAASAGTRYVIEASWDLRPGSWESFGVVEADGAVGRFMMEGVEAEARFYRIGRF